MAARKNEADLGAVEALAAKFCQKEEIARDMGLDKDSFDKKKDVSDAFEKGRNSAKIAVRSLLYDAAVSGDRQAIIFLAKNELGYRDYPQDAAPGGQIPGVIDDVEAGAADD